jgi:peptidyl-prolyl cis-trans isomerase D
LNQEEWFTIKQLEKTILLLVFKETKNAIEFVNENSDIPYDSTYVAKKDLPAEHAEKLFNLPKDKFMLLICMGLLLYFKIYRKKSWSKMLKQVISLISYEGTQVPNKKEEKN